MPDAYVGSLGFDESGIVMDDTDLIYGGDVSSGAGSATRSRCGWAQRGRVPVTLDPRGRAAELDLQGFATFRR